MKLRLNKVFFLSLFVVLEVGMQVIAGKNGWGSQNQGFSFGLPCIAGSCFAGGSILSLLLLFLIMTGKLTEKGWWFILAGGLANSVSRMMMGSVWDYFHWAIIFNLWFNGADILILVGSLMVIVKQFNKADGKT